MNKIIFVRHGETKVNVNNKLHKSNDETSLTNRGNQQMQLTAKYLSSFKINHIISSDSKRTLESSNMFAKIFKLKVITLKGFNERNWGDYEGKEWSEIETYLNKLSSEERYTYIPPNGESWKQFEERLKKTIKLVEDKYWDNVLIVTHGGVIRALMPILLGIPKENSFKYDFNNGSVTIFEKVNNKYKAILINSTSHLV